MRKTLNNCFFDFPIETIFETLFEDLQGKKDKRKHPSNSIDYRRLIIIKVTTYLVQLGYGGVTREIKNIEGLRELAGLLI